MSLTAHQLIGLLVDPGSFVSWDDPVTTEPRDPEYRASLTRARERTGIDEAVVTGIGRIGGGQAALIASEFGFLGGSIGVATAERITRAVEQATAARLPLVALPVSGGTRMQEGSAAFLCMLRITAAVQAHRAAGLPYLTYLRNPTMGGVFASWGTLGHLVLAEPDARLGFLGPRVYEELRGVQLPPDVQRAETLAERGLVDAVVAPEELREVLRRSLAVLTRRALPSPSAVPPTPVPPTPADRPDAWEAVLRTRHPDRPGTRELLRRTTEELVLLDSPGGRDGALVRALAVLDGQPAVVVGQQRRAGSQERPFTAADLRSVRRTARFAEQLGLPLVTVVDTAGAELSVQAELDGVAVEIAHCLTTLLSLRTPVLAVLLGQGSGGGALALLPADRVLAAGNAWLAPLPPEGASAIVHRDGSHAPELARAQGIGAHDLAAVGLVDTVIPELPDAADEPAAFCARLGHAVSTTLATLAATPTSDRLAARTARHRRLGDLVL
ncbi:carboxyl transferase domain-containing protein [Kitasatospora purpeofusca]|uniref:carboxyl transferase domain-containing protein n=1 Tax=Kitasatospora purpeofusca TaxID=67352 RepID=UPI00225A3D09|nr:carboxyl transferase domain-containing protein [Kitasatospora purpeofusca]MCX4756357.1 acetyl-CoA carboxylase carboxyltransferase subunit alpha/beta [Kitasatospora purpeofusca]WSR35817.1 acetyl-CoA carboxylase carboxyltransferase subunit alpha/beta [Kitasatospora purpeofusca]